MRNCTKKLHFYDISKLGDDYHSPMDLIRKYSHNLNDKVLAALQYVNIEYQQTTKTEDSTLLIGIVRKLLKSTQIFRYLLTFTKFIASRFDAPFDINTLDLLRYGNTFHNWSKIDNQCKFNVVNCNKKQYTIMYPAYAAPITVYRNLLNACYLSEYYRIQQSCLQSEKLLQFQLVGWFLLSIIIYSFIYFIIITLIFVNI